MRYIEKWNCCISCNFDFVHFTQRSIYTIHNEIATANASVFVMPVDGIII
jgi:hypothetical protein